MHLKICGLKYPENIEAVMELEPDYMGFIFYEKSPRYAGASLSPDFLWSIPKKIKKVGVFVNADSISVLDTVARYNLDLVQLHGDESPAFCAELNKQVPVIKAFQLSATFNFHTLAAYQESCHFFLFDTASTNFGGSGQQFDHNLLRQYTYSKKIFVSGGLDTAAVKALAGKGVYCADVNSRFESEPGLKDIPKLRELIEIFPEKMKADDSERKSTRNSKH